MKKSFVLLLALLLFISGTAYYAQNELLKEKDQVHFTETVIYGDKAVVEGVTVEMDLSYNEHLFWHTVYEIGAEPKEQTEYTFHPWEYLEYEYQYAGSINFMVDNTDALGFDYENDRPFYGLDAAVKELYDRTEPGTENATTIYLKDYADYYTFGLEITLPYKPGEENAVYDDYGYRREWELREDIEILKESGSNKEQLEKLERYLADMEAFQEFFKIPVLETEVYALAISKDENGEVAGLGVSHMHGGMATGEIDIPDAPNVEGADGFNFGVYVAFDDGDCYMTFDPHTANGNLVDLSQIPGGYGIYHFTYDEKKGTLDLSDLKMVYPLDTNDCFTDMTLDASGENILLFTEDEEYRYLSVIDRDTLTLVDTFKLGDKEEYISYWTYEDYLVVRMDNLMVFPIGGEGRYFQALSVDRAKMEEQISTSEFRGDMLNYDSTFDWNGETLLIANEILYLDEDGRIDRYTSDFYVAAVDETGLLYYGGYESSLNTTDSSYEQCRYNSYIEEPIRIRWN